MLIHLIGVVAAVLTTGAPPDFRAAPQASDATIAARQQTTPTSSLAPVDHIAATTASEPPSAAPPPAMRVLAQRIELEGAPDVPRSQIEAATSPYLGHPLSQDDLGDLLSTVSGLARARGYLFARSWIPDQQLVGETLRIRLDEGRVDEVRLTGARHRGVRAILRALVGQPVKRSQLERRLTLAGDLPGVQIGRVRFVREADRGILIVPVSVRRLGAEIGLDNRGVPTLGPLQLHAGFHVHGLVSGRDDLSVQADLTPADTRQLRAVSSRYAYQANYSGTELSGYGSYGATQPGGYQRGYGAHGTFYSYGAGLAQPLLRGQSLSLWAGGSLDHVSVEQWWAGSPVRRDATTTISGSLNGYVPLAGGRLRAGIGLTQGLDALRATRPGDILASRVDADGRFIIVGAWANWTGDLGGRLSARAAVTTQYSNRPLLAVDQITIGGPAFGRAYDYSERSGDQGVLGSLELRAKLRDQPEGPIRWAQAFAFIDGGRVWNHGNSAGAGELYSAGLGLRTTLTHAIGAEVEVAAPLNADRYVTGNRSPRISFSLSKAF